MASNTSERKRSHPSSATTTTTTRRVIGRVNSGKTDNEGFHLYSAWQEPPRADGLTAYEAHRSPRPVLSGRVRRPLQALLSEFRCVICLDSIRNCRIVHGCLHRFCEECIERSLRLGKNECPICRIAIPSRRSLVADSIFDELIASILGHTVDRNNADGDPLASSDTPHAAHLQRAIHQKRERIFRGDQQGRQRRKRIKTPKGYSPFPDDDFVEILTEKHPRDTESPALKLPFLRLSGQATIHVLQTFLSLKLHGPEDNSAVHFDIFAPMSQRYFATPLPADMTLKDVVETECAGNDKTQPTVLSYFGRHKGEEPL